VPGNNVLKVKLVIIVSLAIIAITTVNIVGSYLFLPGRLSEKKVVIIKEGLSKHEISIMLEQESVIKHRILFEFITRIYGLYRPLRSGEYEFTKAISPYQVLTRLASGKSVVHRLVITEGQTVAEITAKIIAEDRLFGQINMNIPEGYLMPSTYFYIYGDLREKIIDEMRKDMSKALDEVMLKLKPDSPLKTRKDVLILASIIEKEAGNEKERPIVAGVFINRLKKGIKLQADPTVAYAITDGKYKLNRPLSRTDLKIDSKYNTYKVEGLPPGAIACPGLASLEAAVSPAQTNALFFVVDGSGGHSFSSSLEDHNIHVQKLRQREKEKAVVGN
jgi:UPF0755 protein